MKAPLKIINTLLLLSLLIAPAKGTGNDLSNTGNCKFEKSVKVGQGYSLELTNKFGSVSLINNKSDSIRVCATVTIVHKDGEAMIRKSLPMISVSFAEENNILRVETHFDPNFFSTSYSSGRTHFSVDYVVELPEYINIDIKNSYGNLFIPVISGRATLAINNGNLEIQDLRRGNEKPYNSIDITKSSLRINRINWGSVTATYCGECFVGEATAVVVKTVFSNLTIHKAGSVVISSNIGELSINSVEKLAGELELIRANIGRVGKEAAITTSLGQLTLTSIDKGLRSLEITSNGTLISLGISDKDPLNVDVIVTGGKIRMNSDTFPNLHLTRQTGESMITGHTGLNAVAGKITIRANGGSVLLY